MDGRICYQVAVILTIIVLLMIVMITVCEVVNDCTIKNIIFYCILKKNE